MTLAWYWPDVASFLHMGGYGAYVWGAFGVSLGALALELASLRAQRRQALQQAARRLGDQRAAGRAMGDFQ